MISNLNARTERTTPAFAHDCEACEYVGDHRDADLYFCHAHNECVARLSERSVTGAPPELARVYPSDHPVQAAYRRARIKRVI